MCSLEHAKWRLKGSEIDLDDRSKNKVKSQKSKKRAKLVLQWVPKIAEASNS